MRTVIRLKILANLIEREMRTSSAIENMIKMTNMHGRIISYLHRNEGRDIYQRDIEKTFMISGPSVSEVLKLMQKNGLIERQSVKHDARLKKNCANRQRQAIGRRSTAVDGRRRKRGGGHAFRGGVCRF